MSCCKENTVNARLKKSAAEPRRGEAETMPRRALLKHHLNMGKQQKQTAAPEEGQNKASLKPLVGKETKSSNE